MSDTFFLCFILLLSSDFVTYIYVFLQHNGSILSLQIKSSSGEGGERVIWDISDTSLFADDKWLVGQVCRNRCWVIWDISDTSLFADDKWLVGQVRSNRCWVIWDISDTSLFADDKWLVGQVRPNRCFTLR